MEAKMIGILMAAVILASVFVAIVPTVSARPAPDKIDSGDTAYIGEQGLDFNLDGDTNNDSGFDAGEFYVFIDHAKISGDIILNTATQDSIVGKAVPTSSEIVFKVNPNIGTEIPNGSIDIKV